NGTRFQYLIQLECIQEHDGVPFSVLDLSKTFRHTQQRAERYRFAEAVRLAESKRVAALADFAPAKCGTGRVAVIAFVAAVALSEIRAAAQRPATKSSAIAFRTRRIQWTPARKAAAE